MDTELRDLTEGLKKLTEDTVDDSATVKIVTFLSAVYLPGSFIGVSKYHSYLNHNTYTLIRHYSE